MSSMSAKRRPDFAIIGAMKSATSTLQEQLELQPGIFMTTPKEPNFFSNDDQYDLGLDWYANLYSEAAEDDLVGEASTHYTKLPKYPDTVARFKSFAPDTKLIYVMRHPVDRLISHYIHNWSMGFIGKNVSIEQALAGYEPFISYGMYNVQLKPWFEAYGRDNVCPVFFDRMLESPQTELERICKYIGYQKPVTWQENLEASNISNQRIRKFPLYSVVVDSSIATWLRQNFVPTSFRQAIKNRLRLNKRPQLSDQTIADLEAQFDEGLKELGEWLDVELCCQNFKEVTRSRPLTWT